MSSGVVLRGLAEVGPQAMWIVALFAGAIGIVLLYLGIAMLAAIVAAGKPSGKAAYLVFRDLVELCAALFRCKGRR